MMALCLSLLSWYLHESFFYKYTLFILYYSERGDWSPLDSETTLYGKHEKLFIYVKHHFVSVINRNVIFLVILIIIIFTCYLELAEEIR